jgi:ATP-dependent DNA ligase
MPRDGAIIFSDLTVKLAVFRARDGIQYVEHARGHGDKMYAAGCNLGLKGIVSKKIDAPYRSGPSKAWIKVKNPNAPAVTRAADGTF